MKTYLNQTGVGGQGKKLLIIHGALEGDMKEKKLFDLGLCVVSKTVVVNRKSAVEKNRNLQRSS